MMSKPFRKFQTTSNQFSIFRAADHASNRTRFILFSQRQQYLSHSLNTTTTYFTNLFPFTTPQKPFSPHRFLSTLSIDCVNVAIFGEGVRSRFPHRFNAFFGLHFVEPSHERTFSGIYSGFVVFK